MKPFFTVLDSPTGPFLVITTAGVGLALLGAPSRAGRATRRPAVHAVG